MLTNKLTREQQQEILNTLFGLEFVNTKAPNTSGEEHWVLYDEEGDEFYGSDENCQFDFSTLAGIFSYAAYRAKKQGYFDAQFNIKKALGIL